MIDSIPPSHESDLALMKCTLADLQAITSEENTFLMYIRLLGS